MATQPSSSPVEHFFHQQMAVVHALNFVQFERRFICVTDQNRLNGRAGSQSSSANQFVVAMLTADQGQAITAALKLPPSRPSAMSEKASDNALFNSTLSSAPSSDRQTCCYVLHGLATRRRASSLSKPADS